MSWKIDTIDFKDYGVGVSKSTGALDMPRIVDVSTDWLYAEGRDYWQNAGDVKYQAREIALNCWIKASGYEDFKTKVAAFYAALVAPGERTLTTIYGNEIEHVTVQQSIQMLRKTQYVQSLQIGVFTLRLTVAGDSLTKLITVYRQDGEVQGVVKYGSDAKLSRSLQGSSDVTFSSEFNEKKAFGRGDYVIFEFEKYVALEYPKIEKLSTNKWIYRFTYTHEFFFTKDIQFRVIDRADTPWWSNMNDIVDMIITNVNRAYPGKFIKGTVESTENRNHQFTNESCYDVLTRTSGEYELMWEYKQFMDGTIQINVKKQIGYATGDNFEYGKDNFLYKISRESTGRDLMVTRLYAYGSDRNIPATYGYPRLRLPIEPVTRDFYGMHVEKTKVFDDIFPERTGTVTWYEKKTKAATWTYVPGTFPGPNPIKIYTLYPNDNTYEMTDSTMDFDLKELKEDGVSTKYLIAGTTAKIHFNSGDLAGFEFEVLDYNHATKTFKLIPYTDEQGTKYPTDVLFPAIGDEYKILDINIPQSYIDNAVARLQLAADAHIDEFYNPKAQYTVETNPIFNAFYFPGDTVILYDTDYGVDTEMQITEFVQNIYTRINTITLAWFVQNSKRKDIELKVWRIERAVVDAKMDQVENRRASEYTTAEVRNLVVDPFDDKLRADEIVRRKTLDPVMLAEDAKILQYSIKGALVTPNVGDNPNEMTIDAGEFLNHSFYAVDRKTIKIIKAL